MYEEVSFVLLGGEILGFVGFVGVGCSEFVCVFFGIDMFEVGMVEVLGKLVLLGFVIEVIEVGICLVLEDWKLEGLFFDFFIVENIVVLSFVLIFWYGIVDYSVEFVFVEEV